MFFLVTDSPCLAELDGQVGHLHFLVHCSSDRKRLVAIRMRSVSDISGSAAHRVLQEAYHDTDMRLTSSNDLLSGLGVLSSEELLKFFATSLNIGKCHIY